MVARPVSLLVAFLLAGLVLACGGDSDSEAPGRASSTPLSTRTPLVTPSTGGTAGGPEPLLFGPASRFAAGEEDLAGYYLSDAATALVANVDIYGQVGPFKNASEGGKLAAEWGYQDGYLVGYDPVGLLSAVVLGSYYITIDVHLFETVEGAASAYRQYVAFYEGTPGVERDDAPALGNESSGWRALADTLGSTEVPAVYHRFVVRRGNLIIQAETLGGVPFMTIDAAREVARIMDERALGDRPAPVPTPVDVPGQTATPGPTGGSGR